MTTYNQLSNEQRDIIQTLINQKKSFSYISKVIDKDRTTISKEIKRNRYIKSNFYDAFDKKESKKLLVDVISYLNHLMFVMLVLKRQLVSNIIYIIILLLLMNII